MRLKSKIYIFLLLSLCWTSTCFAQSYQIPKDLITEIKANRKIVAENPTAQNYFQLAMSYAYSGMVQQGITTLEQVKKADPTYATVGFKTYEKLTEQNPDNWKNWFCLAFGYYFADENNPIYAEKALTCFTKAYELNPKNIWSLGYMALLKGKIILNQKEALKKQGTDQTQIDLELAPKYTEIINLCDKALAQEPNATGIHFLLGETYRQKGSYGNMFFEGLRVSTLMVQDKKYYKENGLN
jgi:tetratricopeptide (TPR) repeat protein